MHYQVRLMSSRHTDTLTTEVNALLDELHEKGVGSFEIGPLNVDGRLTHPYSIKVQWNEPRPREV